MDIDAIADELTSYSMRKYAEEAELDDGEFEGDRSKADTRQKLRMALYGAGALGLGGLAAWGLSGDMGKRLGQWMGEAKGSIWKPATPGQVALSPITHAGAAGLATALMRSRAGGALTSDISETGEIKNKNVPLAPDDFLKRTAGNYTGMPYLSPQNTPKRLADDLAQLATPAAPKQPWYERLPHLLTVDDDLGDKGAIARLKENLAAVPQNLPDEPKSPPTPLKGRPSPADMAKYKADVSAHEAAVAAHDIARSMRVESGRDPFSSLQGALMTLDQSPRKNPLNAMFSGAFLRRGGELVPLGAAGLSADGVVKQQGEIVYRTLGPDGRFTEKAITASVANSQLAANQALAAGNTDLAHDIAESRTSPTSKVNLFLLQQSTLHNELSLGVQLMKSGDPAKVDLGRAIVQSGLTKHYAAAAATNGYTPNARVQQLNDGTLIKVVENYVQPYARERATSLQGGLAAVRHHRYRPGYTAPIRRGAGAGLRAGLASAAAQTLLSWFAGSAGD